VEDTIERQITTVAERLGIHPDTPFPPSDLRARHPRFTPPARAANLQIVTVLRTVAEIHAANLQIVTVLRTVAEIHAATPAQVALAWILAHGRHVVPIPGTTRPTYLRDNIHAADLELTPQDLADLNNAPPATEDHS
jgi:aryl-alcohol dehydrogenase-like predicted oxidoreductase